MSKKCKKMLKCGNCFLSLRRYFFKNNMTDFIGEYDCKVDAKGRILLPTAFRRKMGDAEPYRFVIKTNMYEQCLDLYTIEAWEEQDKKIKEVIDPFDDEHLQVQREFRRGASEVECDPTGRILVPGRLLKQAEIVNDAILTGFYGKIEIWSPDNHRKSGGDEKERIERYKRIMSNKKSKL